MDNVLLSTDHIEFDDVNKGDLPQQTLLVLNNGKQNYVPELMHLPPYLTAICQPEVLRPGRIGRITLTLDSRLLPNMLSTLPDRHVPINETTQQFDSQMFYIRYMP